MTRTAMIPVILGVLAGCSNKTATRQHDADAPTPGLDAPVSSGGAAGSSSDAAATGSGGSITGGDTGSGGATATGGSTPAGGTTGTGGTAPTGGGGAGGTTGTCLVGPCLAADAGCAGDACSSDGGANDVASGSCSQVTTQTECDSRSDCHSVFVDPGTCRCAAAGCCAHFSRCADGGRANCSGPALCNIKAPFCESPYVVSYTSNCYEGCVQPSECAGGDAAIPPSGDANSEEAPPAVEVPQPIPSHQQVIFRVTNGAATSRYLGIEGTYCAAYAIDDLVMVLDYQCGCECPRPPDPKIVKYWAISPQQTKDLVWDARALKTYSTSVDCSIWGPMATPASVTNGVRQPVGPGRYQVTLTLESVAPPDCTEVDEVLICQWTYGSYSGSTGRKTCPSSATATASFDLPEDGDVVVPITL